MILYPEPTELKTIDDWKKLHSTICHIVVVEANPETLEFESQVFIQDINKEKVYVLTIGEKHD